MPLNVSQTISNMNQTDAVHSHDSTSGSIVDSVASSLSGLDLTTYTVYIGDLPPFYDEAQLSRLLSINTVMPSAIRICRDANTKQSFQYGYLKYNTKADADKAIKDMTFTEIEGYTIRLIHYFKNDKTDKEANIFVKNLPETIKARNLYEFLQVVGPVISIKIPTITKNGLPMKLNYCYIQFENKEHAEKAIQIINSTPINGTSLKASKFEPVNTRQQKKSESLDYLIKYVPLSVTEEALIKDLGISLQDSNKKQTEKDNNAHNTQEEEKIEAEKLFLTQRKNNSNYVFAFITLKNSDSVEKLKTRVKEFNEQLKKLSQTDSNNSTNNRNVPGLVVEKVLTKVQLVNQKRARSMQQESKMRGKNVYIHGIPKDWTNEKLQELCGRFGEIESIHIPRSPNSFNTQGLNMGYGYCCFKEEESATNMVETLDGYPLEKKNLTVCLAGKHRKRANNFLQEDYSQDYARYYPQTSFHAKNWPDYNTGYYGPQRRRDYRGPRNFHDFKNRHYEYSGMGGKYKNPRNREMGYGAREREYGQNMNNNANEGAIKSRIENEAMRVMDLKPEIAKLVSATMMKVYGSEKMEEMLGKENEFKQAITGVLDSIQSDKE